MSATWPVSQGVFSLGDLDGEPCGTIQDARLTWQAHGTLNEARDDYPAAVTMADKVGAQFPLLTGFFGVSRLAAADQPVGASEGKVSLGVKTSASGG